jgi:hypothetical protein
MTHPAPDRLAALAERSREEASDPHLGDCDRCRRAVDDLRAVLAVARQDVVPEPSPLFWDHFSARVRRAVAAQSEMNPRSWAGTVRARRLLPAALAVAMVLVVSTGLAVRFWHPRAPVPTPASAAPLQQTAASSETRADDELADPSWSLVTDLAEDLDWDSASALGMGPAPGSAEQAAAQLSSAERSELVRLITSELGGSPS